MRKPFIFLILLIFLCLFRVGYAAHSISQFRMARGFESVIHASPQQADHQGDSELEPVLEREKYWRNEILNSGIEFLLLGGIAVVYFTDRRFRQGGTQQVSLAS